MMTADVEKFHFRLVLLGSLGTGFLFKKFETKYKPTVEDLFSQDFDLGSIVIKVDFLDTSGSMQFPAMRRLSLTTGSAFLMVYALDDENSYEVLKICMQELQEVRPDFQEIPIVFAGNKCDTPRDKRKVSKEVVSNYVHYELPRLRAKVIECSCRDNINIDNIFRAYMSLAKVTLSTAVSAGLKLVGSHSGSGPSLTSGHSRGSPTLCPPTTSSPSHSHQAKDITSSISSEQHTTSDGNTETTESLPPTNKTSEQHQQQQYFFANRRPSSSIRTGLSVRKSCDASIVSPRRGTFFGIGQQTTTATSDHYNNNNNNSSSSSSSGNNNNSKHATGKRPSSGCATSASTPTGKPSSDRQQYHNGHENLEEFNLEMAIQSKLNLNERAKPRSRSLIWRPSRTKSTRNNSNAINAANGSECRVT